MLRFHADFSVTSLMLYRWAINATGLLKDQMYLVINKRSLRHEYPPGDRLSADWLAQEYSISTTPVRQALSVLEEDGLVSILPRAGCFVSPITLLAVREVSELRMVLEGATAQMEAQLITPEELE